MHSENNLLNYIKTLEPDEEFTSILEDIVDHRGEGGSKKQLIFKPNSQKEALKKHRSRSKGYKKVHKPTQNGTKKDAEK